MKISVTQKHINSGICGHPNYCAVALALKGPRLPRSLWQKASRF